MLRTLSLLVLVISLAACGGSGGGSNPPEPPAPEPLEPNETEPEPEPEPEPEEPPPPPKPVSIRDTLSELIRSSDTVTDASTIDGEAFLWNVTVQPRPSSLTLTDITRYDDEPFQALGTRRGIERGTYQELSVAEFGGWLTHSFFLVNVWNPVGDDPLHPSESTFSHVYSIGDATGSNPVRGGATWTGVMAGIDEREGTSTFGNLLEGDAQVGIDSFSNPDVDVALTNIHDRQTGGQHGSISWNNLPLSAGAFSSTGLSGRFYGPNHEEVGGIFLRNRISGAFGAKRQ